MPLHPFNQRWIAEDLVRRRRADDRDRYAVSQRQARIDPNPHQIDAVIFALRRIEEGGCILADEVGLGKTIEAGLVIAQGRAEGRERVLLVVPKTLLGQWQSELLSLFSLEVRELDGPNPEPGVWILGREAAGGVRGSEWLRAAPFDLVVIDEAHEMFAGIYRRYRPDGTYDAESPHASTAHRVRAAIGHAPVLVLTATPIQNSLAELWGLVQYVDPTRTLFGDLATFRQVFCAGDDRVLVEGQEHELQRRIATVCKRTLRRNAQEFLDQPFVDRACRLFEYPMSPDEKALYEDVTEWLMKPVIHAFKGRSRKLLLIGFHRRMASSLAALAASLDHVARRLRGEAVSDEDLLADLDVDEEPLDLPGDGEDAPAEPGGVAAELALVESFARRARALPSDTKAVAFTRAIALVLGRGSGKAVVFTEAITTQEYIRDVLLADGLAPEDVTLFRGSNTDARAREALAAWRDGPGRDLAVLPSPDIQVRLALVHEFRTRSKVLICTEAGAKGLNLQFCETVINYDLPWNPQRIEQRIGRCHRYGQKRSVLVVNFLASDNEAHRLTFDILSRKLDLFGRVLDASDAVLHEPKETAGEALLGALSADFERELRRIHDRARSQDDVIRDVKALRDAVVERRATYERQQKTTTALIESRFDDEVKQVFRGLKSALSAGLARLDATLAVLVPDHAGPERLTMVHPAVRAAVAAARAWPGGPLAFDPPTPALAGARGSLVLAKVAYGGFEPVERLVAAAVVDGAALDPEQVAALLAQPARDGEATAVDHDALASALDEALFFDQQAIEGTEQARFERAMGQLERFADDRLLIARQERTAAQRTLERARERRDKALGSDARTRAQADMDEASQRIEGIEQRISDLDARRDEDYQRWRQHHHDRRYQAPTVQRLLTVPFQLGRTASC